MCEGLVSVDGPLASGKTPFCAKLAAAMRDKGVPTTLTKALSETPVGAAVRSAQFQVRGRGLAYLAAADRQLQFDDLVVPALARGEHVLLDRYLLTGIALDGYGAGLGPDLIWTLYEHLPRPATSFLVLASIDYRVERLEAKGLLESYHQWFMRLESESEVYRRAADFLEKRGWNFEVITQPLTNMDEKDFDSLATKILRPRLE